MSVKAVLESLNKTPIATEEISEAVKMKIEPGMVYHGTKEAGYLFQGFNFFATVGIGATKGMLCYATNQDGTPRRGRPVDIVFQVGMDKLKGLDSTTVQSVGKAKGHKTVKKSGYSWVLTKDKGINDRLALHDERYLLFDKKAPKEIEAEFDDLEDVNNHQEAGALVAQFAKDFK